MSSLPPDVIEALRKGNKIEAIKLLRAAMGVGLAEAKGAVEHFERRSSSSSPSASSQPSSSTMRRPAVLPRPSISKVARGDGLSPGEVPRSSFNAGAAVAIAVIAALAGWLFAKFG